MSYYIQSSFWLTMNIFLTLLCPNTYLLKTLLKDYKFKYNIILHMVYIIFNLFKYMFILFSFSSILFFYLIIYLYTIIILIEIFVFYQFRIRKNFIENLFFEFIKIWNFRELYNIFFIVHKLSPYQINIYLINFF